MLPRVRDVTGDSRITSTQVPLTKQNIQTTEKTDADHNISDQEYHLRFRPILPLTKQTTYVYMCPATHKKQLQYSVAYCPPSSVQQGLWLGESVENTFL